MAKRLKVDRLLFLVVVLLTALGTVMVLSTSAIDGQTETTAKQSLAAILGLSALIVLMNFDYRKLKSRWVVYTLFCGAALLLAAVLFSPEINGSRRWLPLGPLTFQPSELGKLALIVFLAYQIDRKVDRINEASFLVPAGVALSLVATLVLVEPDFGTTGLILSTAFVLLFLAGLAWRTIGGIALLVLPVAWVLIFAVDYRRERFLAFLNPEADPLNRGFQVLQSLIAVGSGGLTGVGLGGGAQKLHYLPEAESDFIFAILCEELGFVGGAATLLLFAVFVWRGALAGRDAPDVFGKFLAWGITAAIAIQALVNISVTVGLLPITGTPLPFLSSGGSSLVISLTAAGLLLNISQHR